VLRRLPLGSLGLLARCDVVLADGALSAEGNGAAAPPSLVAVVLALVVEEDEAPAGPAPPEGKAVPAARAGWCFTIGRLARKASNCGRLITRAPT